MTRAEVLSTIRVNTVVIYFLVEFMRLWSTFYNSPSYRIQKIHRFHWIFDTITFLSTFMLITGLPAPIGLISTIIAFVLDIGFGIFMVILIGRCQNTFKNVCFRTLFWDYGLIIVLGIIIFLEFQILINLNILKAYIVPEDNLSTEYMVFQHKMRLRTLHIVSMITSAVLIFLAWYTQPDFEFRNDGSEDYYLALNLILSPGLIWLSKKKTFVLKVFAQITSLSILVAHIYTFNISYILVNTTSVYKEIKYKLLVALIFLDIIIGITHIMIVYLTPTLLTKWTNAGASIKWWFIRQNERLQNKEIKTS